MIISQIAAMAANRTIGVDGKLPWNLPEDLKFFKEKTKDHMIVMGRKTFESLPKPLPDRLNIVITRQEGYKAPEGVKVFASIEKAFEFCSSQTEQWGEEVFVVGGSEIYKQTLEHTTNLYITEIQNDYEGDTHFPQWGNEFVLAEKEDRFEPIKYSFCLYKNKSPKTVSI